MANELDTSKVDSFVMTGAQPDGTLSVTVVTSYVVHGTPPATEEISRFDAFTLVGPPPPRRPTSVHVRLAYQPRESQTLMTLIPPPPPATAEPANYVYAGPPTAPPALPTFRPLVGADLPTPAPTSLGGVKALTPTPHQFVTGIDLTGQPQSAQVNYTDLAGLPTTGPGSGTVTSVAIATPNIFVVTGSPITGSGTLTLTNHVQNANFIYAGPTSGGALGPTFRALVAADLPASGVTAGSYTNTNLTVNAQGQITAAASGTGGGGSGTVTSVGLTADPAFSVSGSPVTLAGTLGFTANNQNANLVWAGPSSGGAAAPTFRALTSADMPTSGAGSGTVTSVGITTPNIFTVTGSPVTGIGTLTLTSHVQNANTVWAGPTSGGALGPTFRALVAADLPSGLGTVTSVGLSGDSNFTITGSPVTTSGTLSFALANQAQNLVLAGPATGFAAAPTWRNLVPADFGPVSPNAFLAGPSSGSTAVNPTFRALNVNDLPTGIGTVTSVALSMPGHFSVTGSPITGSGAFLVSWVSEAANNVFAAPNGSAGTPGFRLLAAADIPTLSYLPLSGGTLTNNLTIAPTGRWAEIILNKDSGTTGEGCDIQGNTAGVNRWDLVLGDGTNETGSGNTGSNFDLYSYSDAGSVLGTLNINRANFLVSVIPPTGQNAAISLNFPASGTSATLYGANNNSGTPLNRWSLQLGNGSTETGTGNAGSDLVLTRYSDAGASLGAVLTIVRGTGAATFAGSLISGVCSTGIYQVATHILFSSTNPTITSGLGTSPTVTTSVGNAAGRFTVGASGTPTTTTVIGLPASINGWTGRLTDITAGTVAIQTGSTTTSATFTWAAAPANSDVILYNFMAF